MLCKLKDDVHIIQTGNLKYNDSNICTIFYERTMKDY